MSNICNLCVKKFDGDSNIYTYIEGIESACPDCTHTLMKMRELIINLAEIKNSYQVTMHYINYHKRWKNKKSFKFFYYEGSGYGKKRQKNEKETESTRHNDAEHQCVEEASSDA